MQTTSTAEPKKQNDAKDAQEPSESQGLNLMNCRGR